MMLFSRKGLIFTLCNTTWETITYGMVLCVYNL